MLHPRISPDRIERAVGIIDPLFLNSPQIASDALSRVLNAEVLLKVETLNPIRSFKGRGSDWFVRCQTGQTPLVVPSAGNFGQGLAYCARRPGIDVQVFAPEPANPLKVKRMRELGATVFLKGDDFDAAKVAARAHAAQHGFRFVEDGFDPEISEGAGTIAMELLRSDAKLDAVLVAVGNGALINGIGTWIKYQAPSIRVIGVCAANAPCMEQSWRSGSPISTASAHTIADGLAVRSPVAAAVEDMRAVVDEFLLVEEETILEAMRAILRSTGLLVEPSGAAGVAAVMANTERFRGQRLATVLCGGNVTDEQFRQWYCS